MKQQSLFTCAVRQGVIPVGQHTQISTALPDIILSQDSLVAVGTAVGEVGSLAEHASIADADVKAFGSNGLHTGSVRPMEHPLLITMIKLWSGLLKHS